MRKKFFAWVMTFAMLLSLVPTMGITAGAEGPEIDTSWYTNHESEPSFTLQDVADLEGLARLVNAGNSFAGKTITLADEFSDTTSLTTPIGIKVDYSFNYFCGTFDGNNKTVNLNISCDNYGGLFGCTKDATIMNVTVSGSIAASSESEYVGGIVGYAVGTSTITSCTNDGDITVSDNVGGIVGYAGGPSTITSCTNDGDITGNKKYVSGIVGYAVETSTITSCTNDGDITGNDYVGGVAGQNEAGEVGACVNKGSISGYSYVGGICGGTGSAESDCTVSDCKNEGTVVNKTFETYEGYGSGDMALLRKTENGDCCDFAGRVGRAWVGVTYECKGVLFDYYYDGESDPALEKTISPVISLDGSLIKFTYTLKNPSNATAKIKPFVTADTELYGCDRSENTVNNGVLKMSFDGIHFFAYSPDAGYRVRQTDYEHQGNLWNGWWDTYRCVDKTLDPADERDFPAIETKCDSAFVGWWEGSGGTIDLAAGQSIAVKFCVSLTDKDRPNPPGGYAWDDSGRLVEHTHNWSFTEKGATIDATCTTEMSHKESLTISASDASYDGNPHGATCRCSSAFLSAVCSNITYQKQESGGGYSEPTATVPTEAGVYKASVTVGTGENTAAASVVYAIDNGSRLKPVIATNPTSSAIGHRETLENSTLTGGSASVAGTFSWKAPDTRLQKSESGTNQTVVFTPDDLLTYERVEISVPVTVESGTVTAQWTGTTVTYNQAVQRPDGSLTSENSEIKGVWLSSFKEEPQDAGTYTLTARLAGDEAECYTLANPTVIFTIQKYPVTFKVENNCHRYDGSAKTATVTNTEEKLTSQNYAVSYRDSDGAAVEAPTAVGTYDVYVTLTESTAKNYCFADSTTVTSEKVGVLVIYSDSEPTTYTVHFGAYADSVAGYAGTVLRLPEPKDNTIPADKVFTGWKAPDGRIYPAGESFTIPESNVEFAAQWADGYTVSGTVKKGETPLPNAQVELMYGNKVVDTTVSDANGEYTFTEKVSNGTYQVISTFEGAKRAAAVTVDEGSKTEDISMPTDGNKNTCVEVKTGAPAIVVEQLEKAFDGANYTEDDQATVGNGGTVEFRLTAENKDTDIQHSEDAETKEIAKTFIDVENSNIGVVLDLTIHKYVMNERGEPTQTEPEVIREMTDLVRVEVPIPAKVQGITTTEEYVLYRAHTTDDAGTIEVESITSSPKDGEYLTQTSDTSLTLYVKKFSTYVISYKEKDIPVEESAIQTPVTSGSDSRSTSYAVKTLTEGIGTVSADKLFAIAGNKVTLTVAPASGWTLEGVTAKDENGTEVTLTEGSESGQYTFQMPAANVVISVHFAHPTPVAEPVTESVPQSTGLSFTDVIESDYFYTPVLWAVENGITNGVTETTFCPYDITTRAQMVTFLWRASGSPEAASATNPFTDVMEGDYFYRAVLWGYENGYVKGTSETTFSPNDTVTRGQAVTFLGRMAGITDEAEGYAHAFTDVDPTQYYSNSIAWASQKGITNGTGENTFSPDQGCQRGEVVTFLYRNANP